MKSLAYLLLFLPQVACENPSRKLTPNGWVFEPILTFTEPGFSTRDLTLTTANQKPWHPLSHAGCSSTHGSDSSPVSSSSGCVWSIQAGEVSEFTVHGFMGPKQWKCQDGGRTGDLLVWVRSVDGSVIFAPPALPSSTTWTQGDLSVSLIAFDEGVYDVTLVVADSSGQGKQRLLPVKGGGWRMWVSSQQQQHAPQLQAPPGFKVKLPTATCNGVDSPAGRWLKCSAAGISPRSCLRDGWVFVPYECRYTVLGDGASLLQRAADIRPLPASGTVATGSSVSSSSVSSSISSSAKPVWVVVVGSSIERGTFHTMVDLVAGVSRIQSKTSKYLASCTT
jgi:hypothetical protein